MCSSSDGNVTFLRCRASSSSSASWSELKQPSAFWGHLNIFQLTLRALHFVFGQHWKWLMGCRVLTAEGAVIHSDRDMRREEGRGGRRDADRRRWGWKEEESRRPSESRAAEWWGLTTCARGPTLRNSPQLCHKQEVDQKQDRGGTRTGVSKRERGRERTPLKGHNTIWRAAQQTSDKIHMWMMITTFTSGAFLHDENDQVWSETEERTRVCRIFSCTAGNMRFPKSRCWQQTTLCHTEVISMSITWAVKSGNLKVRA